MIYLLVIIFIGLLCLGVMRERKKQLDERREPGIVYKNEHRLVTETEKQRPGKKIAKRFPLGSGKYPQFIPFYEWHGFIKGLHPSTREHWLNYYGILNGTRYAKKKK